MTASGDPEAASPTRKVDIVHAIASALGIEAQPMSTGSTEPRSILVAVNDHLGLGIRPKAGKAELARGIVEASGESWLPDYESSGATITRKGLAAVHRAVCYFLGE